MRKMARLIEAASNGDVAGCERLVTGGLAVDAVDSSGDTALDWAVYNCKTEVVRKLLALGANANRVDLMGRTPLVYTATALRGHKLLGTDRERSVIAQLLVANKAEVNHACPDGQTALHFAARGKR